MPSSSSSSPLSTSSLTRRIFLGSATAVGALVVGWSVLPPRQRLNTAQPLPTEGTQHPLNGWVKLDAQGVVTIMLAKSEMGQGVSTALAMVLADEMEADWSLVRTETAPIDPIYNNIATVVDSLPFHPDDRGALRQVASWMTAKTLREVGVMMTGGSSSIKDLWLPMREAGALARQLLVGAAAAQWAVPASDCKADNGRVLHPASGRALSYGELARAAAVMPLPAQAVLKQVGEFRLIGRALPRTDSAVKSDGSARFGIDARPSGLLYASVRMCPTLGGQVAQLDDAAARALPGVREVVVLPALHGSTAGVAVIADSWWQAHTAAQALVVQWEAGPAGLISSAEQMDALARVLDTESGWSYYSTGDVSQALAGAASTLKAEYRAPWLAHMPMEPMNCTVQFKDGQATVWAATQVPGLSRMAVARVLGIEPGQVTVHVPFLGGGFGRRLEIDVVAQAAFIARHANGAPVQTLWSREEDTTHDFYRPACVARWEAGLDARGQLLGLRVLSAGQMIVPQVLGRVFGLPAAGPDKTSAEGAFDQPYEWPAARIAHQAVALPVPVGFWRSVGHSHQAFFKESFVDELATAVGEDAVAYRLALLTRHPRHAAVLKAAADAAGWGQPLVALADGTPRARGVALHQSFGSIVAQVVEVSVDRTKTIRVHRVVSAVDCGLVVNPQLVAQQIESAVVMGLSAALWGGVTIDKGQVRQTNFHDQPALRMAECPVFETHLMPSTEHPEGVGEPGLPPVAPAVANALFALTGQRLRSLPLVLA
jgi:isoquinoline 1-oxidoreductase subunit beta